MINISDALKNAFNENTYKCILSNPRNKDTAYKKIEISRVEGQYLFEKYTATQVFHEKRNMDDTRKFIAEMMETGYKNFNSWENGAEHSLLISKKGKVTHSCKRGSADVPKERLTHNREKNYILDKGSVIEPLVDMGIFTKEGKVVNSMYDKYKQINRFIEIVDDEVKKTGKKDLTVLDFGCGKSYLTFILYYYFKEIRGVNIKMTGLDLKSDVVEKCNKTAEKYGYDNLHFQVGDISGYKYSGKIDIVITLHACDTATDYALYNAIKWDADMIFSVPCCQHEVAGQISADKLSLLTRYGIVKERFSALLTDAVRCNLLQWKGYKTQMVEFVAFDHTPKNIMIRAVKSKPNKEALLEAERAIDEFGINPTLYRLLKE